jgi:hypothetical protein
MRGVKLPRHAVPPAPTITSTAAGPAGIRVYWRGSAGAARYSVQMSESAQGPWTTPCRRCATDVDDGWLAPAPAWFRVVPFNLDGRAGPPSPPFRPTG